MNLHHQPLVLMTVFCLLGCVACATAPKPSGELDSLLRTVSYENPVAPVWEDEPTTTADVKRASPSFGAAFLERARETRQSISNGVKATAGLLLLGVVSLIEASLGSDDDQEISYFTPRAQADRDLDHWVDDDARWERSR